MTGRVALQTGISDVVALKGQAKRIGAAYQTRLTDEARGKIVIGDTTFLFQFVAPPPPQPRPQLPLSVKGGLASQIDWNLTIIAAFSFLLHFGIIGAMYSDWLDPIVVDKNDIQALVDLGKNVPPPVIEDPTPQPVATATAQTTPDKTTPTQANTTKSGGNSGPKGSSVSDRQAAALAAQAEAMQLQLLGATGGGPAVANALNRSDVPTADLSSVAASGAGVSNVGGDLRMGTAGGGQVRPGSAGNGLGGIAKTGGGSGNGSGAGNETAVKGPTGDAQIGQTSSSVPINNAERVVANLRRRFKSCYDKGLQSDPSMSGSVTIAAKVGPNGEVQSADPAGGSGLSAEVVQCIQRAVRSATFDSPGSSTATINIPVKFVQQK